MNEEHAHYAGTFYFLGIAVTIRPGPDGMEAVMSGAPDGYEIPLEHVRDRVYRMRGGPLGEAEVEFIPDAHATVDLDRRCAPWSRPRL